MGVGLSGGVVQETEEAGVGGAVEGMLGGAREELAVGTVGEEAEEEMGLPEVEHEEAGRGTSRGVRGVTIRRWGCDRRGERGMGRELRFSPLRKRRGKTTCLAMSMVHHPIAPTPCINRYNPPTPIWMGITGSKMSLLLHTNIPHPHLSHSTPLYTQQTILHSVDTTRRPTIAARPAATTRARTTAMVDPPTTPYLSGHKEEDMIGRRCGGASGTRGGICAIMMRVSWRILGGGWWGGMAGEAEQGLGGRGRRGMRVMMGVEGNGQQGLGGIPYCGIELRGGSSMEGQQEIMRRV